MDYWAALGLTSLSSSKSKTAKVPADASDVSKLPGGNKAANLTDTELEEQQRLAAELRLPEEVYLRQILLRLDNFQIKESLPKNINTYPNLTEKMSEESSNLAKVNLLMQANIKSLFEKTKGGTAFFDGVDQALLNIVSKIDRDTASLNDSERYERAQEARKYQRGGQSVLVKFYPLLLDCIKMLSIYCNSNKVEMNMIKTKVDGIIYTAWIDVLSDLVAIHSVIVYAQQRGYITQLDSFVLDINVILSNKVEYDSKLRTVIREHNEKVVLLQQQLNDSEREQEEIRTRCEGLRAKINLAETESRTQQENLALQNNVALIATRNLERLSLSMGEPTPLQVLYQDSEDPKKKALEHYNACFTNDPILGAGVAAKR